MAAISTNDSNNNPLASHEDRVLAASIALSTLRALGREDLIPHLVIDWSHRFTNAMGTASYLNVTESSRPRLHKSERKYVVDGRICHIRLSSVLWPRASQEDRRQTVIHEVCHVVTSHEDHLKGRSKSKAHGLEWQATMLRAGVCPTRCHHVNTVGLRRKSTKTETVHCKCREHQVTKAMATKIAKGVPHICRVCHTNIKLNTKPSAPAPKVTMLGGWRIPSPATMEI